MLIKKTKHGPLVFKNYMTCLNVLRRDPYFCEVRNKLETSIENWARSLQQKMRQLLSPEATNCRRKKLIVVKIFT